MEINKEEKFELNEAEKDENGATMVEYALLVALIAVVSIVVITNIGTTVKAKFSEVESAIANN